MKISSVIEKHVVIINGKEHVLSSTSWTESVKDAKQHGVEFEDENDVIDWITQN